MGKNVCILMPMYNEAGTIQQCCRRVLALSYLEKLIIVDDASSDGSAELVQEIRDDRITLIRHDRNQGKTAALATGLQHATSEVIVIQDADMEYDPAEIEYLCEPIWSDQADVVYGSRFLVRRASRVLYFYHYLGNKILSFLSNLMTNKNMSDVETGYKAFRGSVLSGMPITSRRFGFEVEVTAKICKTKARIYETPISYYGRTYEQGKKITAWDGLMALWYILKYNLYVDAATRAYIKRVNHDLAATGTS